MRFRFRWVLLAHTACAYVPWNQEDDYFTVTVAGSQGMRGSADGDHANAIFDRPDAVAIDDVANELYVADRGNHLIRVVRVWAPGNASDFVYTLAGGGVRGYADGIGTNARFASPAGVAVDGFTRLLFVSDSDNMVIRKIDLDTNRVTTLAGSPGVPGFVNGRGEAAAFSRPSGLALALRSRQLLVCDPFNHAVRTVHVVSREVRTLAGRVTQGSTDGVGELATFHLPEAITIDEDEAFAYLGELSPLVHTCMHTCMDGWVDGWMHACACMHVYMGGSMDACIQAFACQARESSHCWRAIAVEFAHLTLTPTLTLTFTTATC